MSRELMQQALYALEAVYMPHHPTVNALRQALETEQQPVAWMHPKWLSYTRAPAVSTTPIEGWYPLYTSPPKQWVGLTDEEIEKIEDEYIGVDYRIPAGCAWNFAKDIEARLKEKNHG